LNGRLHELLLIVTSERTAAEAAGVERKSRW
ncbi:MAG: hypothetical protein ACI867_002315, partial [Glaciecola sp.]